jgi:hypothetical protein
MITVSGAVCGNSQRTIELKGAGTSGAVAISPTTIDFGLVACGATAAASTFTIGNTGNVPFTWTAGLGLGDKSPYHLSAQGGVISAGTSQTVTVTPSAIPSTSATTADLYGDKITVATNVAGDTPHTITLACKTSCKSIGDCASGFTCDTAMRCVQAAVCADPHTAQDATGAKTECAP